MIINIDRLREDLAQDSYAGAFGGVPAMIVEAWDIENASPEKLVRIAMDRGINLAAYEDSDYDDSDYEDYDY